MISVLRIPQLSSGSDETTLVEWSVSPRVQFDAGASLGVVETDKALVDLPADQPGVILLTLVEPGTKVRIDDPIAIVGTLADVDRSAESLLAEVGLAPAGQGAEPVVVAVPAGLEVASAPPPSERIFVSPLARRLARQANVDLAGVIGTGPDGRITRRDVQAVQLTRPPKPPTQRPLPAPTRPVAGRAREQSKLRRAMAAHLTISKSTVPHFYVRGRARMEALLAARDELNLSRAADSKITINDLIVKAVGRAHRRVPSMNTVWTEDRIVELDNVDVAVAVATDGGVVTPVVRSVDLASIDAVSAATRRLNDDARAGRVRQADIDGGTITVSNLGMFGVDEFVAIINPPQSAVLAVGGVQDEPVVADNGVGIGKVVRFTLSVDHRPIDGADAARWMSEFVSLIESPIRLLA